ncbi:unnamed protein product [Linum tenue]|uniref:BACK domain-containing protein n=1 Tax=Linum tenue TaxID=586396 RepID=A0AAV0JZ13_9ROSI|nr:unnamed protein product [Linum tenue]
MRELGADLFEPRTLMDSDFSPTRTSGSSADSDFGFAFNDRNFSDRVLKIEIIPDLPDTKSDGDGCITLAEWARNRKRRREEIKKENVAEVIGQSAEQVLNLNVPDVEETLAYDNQDEEVVAMIEESAADGGLNLNEQEEAALMELLNFMYSNTLSSTTPTALLDVLMAADKFEVVSCMRYCSRLLRNLPMTSESALLYLELPSTVLMAEAVQPLTDAAKQFLAGRYKDMSKFQDEVLNLPLAGIEAVLASDDLQVASEDAVYDFVLKWARIQYPRLEERRDVLGTRLVRLIRFAFMTCRKLRKVLTCNDFDHDVASKVVLDALFFKGETPYRQRALALEEANAPYRRLVERSYKYRPVKVVEFDLPRQQCVVYLDLKRDECTHLFPAGRVYSQAFHLGGQGFFLSAHCNMDQQSSFHCFGLFLGMQEKGSVSFAVDYEFAARSKPTDEFVSKYKGNYTFTGGKAVGYRNLFGVPWEAFMAEDSPFFINSILHLRAELTIRQ